MNYPNLTIKSKKINYHQMVTEQKEWIVEHGGDISGYILRYKNDGPAIYNADMEELHRRERLAGEPVNNR